MNLGCFSLLSYGVIAGQHYWLYNVRPTLRSLARSFGRSHTAVELQADGSTRAQHTTRTFNFTPHMFGNKVSALQSAPHGFLFDMVGRFTAVELDLLGEPTVRLSLTTGTGENTRVRLLLL